MKKRPQFTSLLRIAIDNQAKNTEAEVIAMFREYKKRYENCEFVNTSSTVPSKITDEIVNFCQSIDPTQKPVYIPVQSIAGYTENFCWQNVSAHIREYGGNLRHGWTIWETPGYLLDAEFHGVWEGPSGELLDVTEKSDGEKQILFLPDSTRIYENKVVENLRKPLITDARMKFLLRYWKAEYQYKQKDLAWQEKIIQQVMR